MSFTHLHLHSQYSLLDGAIKLKDLMKYTTEFGMDSVAVTDHGNMYGAVDFFKKAKSAGIKPIIGCEVYVAENDRFDKTNRKAYHLVLLAKNLTGYRNLVYLVSMGHMEGFYYFPRIDKKLLGQYSEGLVGLTACLGGEVPQAIMKGNMDKAASLAKLYKSLFEPGSFFFELQDNGYHEQGGVNDALLQMSADFDIPYVATNDCHYLRREDAQAHEILMCIQMGKTLEDEKRLKHDTDELYFKRPEEMIQRFAHLPEAIANTQRIAEMCNVEIPLGEVYLPTYETPDEHNLESYLRKVTQDGLEERYAEMEAKGLPYDRDEYQKRLEHELDVIIGMKFPGYFLIVWDFINYGKSIGVPIGPGRGSGAGSLVAFALRITDIDPIPYALLFERFLNPERVSMPDFDIDFCMNRRDEVIKYVTEKYGADHVGQIVTFGSLKARGVVRDVSRALALPFAEADGIAKLVPDVLGITLAEGLKQEPKFKALYDEDPKVKRVVDVSMALEGLNRHTGMHAAGIVIGDKPLWEYAPLCRGGSGELVTQFAKEEVEEAGLVKFDFLGLRTLTVIDEAVRFVHAGHDPEFDISTAPLDDPAVYKMISAGETTGVFQLESSGFQDLMKRLKPDRFEDIIAAVALYRPGPLEGGMVDDFVRRKHGEIKVEYPHPLLEDVLKETYGVIVYQEQVMQIANILAGYSLGEADMLRRAMGKKKVEVMVAHRERFRNGAIERNIDPDLAMDIFDLVEKFAGYGFNKSHSAAYALITFQTAYLKAHYPVEFMAAMLTSVKENTEKVVTQVAEVRSKGIEVKQPDVNLSGTDFTVVEEAIRFGLSAVKGIGGNAVKAIIEERESGPFESLGDFCERVDSRRVNRKVLESLVKCGAFDFTGDSRHVQFASIEKAMDRGAQAQRDRASGQVSMFDMFGGGGGGGGASSSNSGSVLVREDQLEPDQIWSEQARLSFEKECLGFYITGHPLDRYQKELKRYANSTTGKAHMGQHRAEVSVAGVVAAIRERQLKNGKGRMAFIQFEDREGQIELVVFAKVYMESEDVFKCDEPLIVRGTIQIEGEGANVVRRIRANEVVRLAEVREARTSRVDISLDAERVETSRGVQQLQGVLRKHPGSCEVRVHIRIPETGVATVKLGDEWRVAPSDAMMDEMERTVGQGQVVLA